MAFEKGAGEPEISAIPSPDGTRRSMPLPTCGIRHEGFDESQVRCDRLST